MVYTAKGKISRLAISTAGIYNKLAIIYFFRKCEFMNWKTCLVVLTCNVLFMSSSYTMIMPFLPIYLTRELGVRAADVHLWSGIVFSASFVISAVMAPVWGKMADRRGKKLMALRASILLAVSYFLGGIVTGPIQLTLMRMFQGFATGLWPMELAIMTSYAPPQKLGVCLGVMQGSLTAGSVIGPLFGGVLAEIFGMRMSFFLAAGALFINFLMLFIFIKEPLQISASDEPTGAYTKKEFSIFKSPVIRDMLTFAVFVQMTILLVQPVMATYIEELTGNSENIAMKAGFVFSLSGFAGAAAAPLWGRFGQHKGFYNSLICALTLAGIIAVVQSIPHTLFLFATAQFCVGLFFSGINPSINAILAKSTPNNAKGRVFGLLFSAQQLGSFIGPLLGAFIATAAGMHYIFIVAGIILLAISVAVRRHKPAQTTDLYR